MRPTPTVRLLALTLLGALALGGCSPRPPIAEKQRVLVEKFGDLRADDYAWLRDRDDPRTLRYLEAENAYADAVMKPLRPLRERLFSEMLSRIKTSDETAAWRKGDWLYFSRTHDGKDYPSYWRRPVPGGDEQLLLDLNELAAESAYLSLGVFEISDDGQLLLYSLDRTGGLDYTLYVRDLRTGQVVGTPVEQVENACWVAGKPSFAFVKYDEVKRPCQLWLRSIDGKDSSLLYEEADREFNLGLRRTLSGAFLVVTSASYTTSEVRVWRADDPSLPAVVIEPRRAGVEYYVQHQDQRFLVVANDTGPNFRLCETPVQTPGRVHWRELVGHDPRVMIEDVLALRDHLVLSLRSNGLPALRVMDCRSGESHDIAFDEPVYFVAAENNHVFDASVLRLRYESLVTPPTDYDYDLQKRTLTVVKRLEVLGGFDPSKYQTLRLWAPARGGGHIPISLVFRVDFPPGPRPTLLYGYGAYGLCEWPQFSRARLSLLDRGVVYAIAHVRGGGELGRPWADAGRLMNKRNSFSDFIDAAEFLIDRGVARRDGIVAHGASAGGLLVAASINARPDLFRAALLEVPFVDVLNTMLDDSLPLTTQEYTQWGDPNRPDAYRYIRSYSPYEGLRAADYPAMLVMTSVNDSQVLFHEPAKYVARLRAVRTNDAPLLFRCDMGSGHAGASGRNDALREEAFRQAFILWQLGLAD